MTDDTRRPSTDGDPGASPVERGYLLGERLAESDAARIAARLDRAMADRASSRWGWRVASGVAAGLVLAAVAAWLVTRPSREIEVQPAPQPQARVVIPKAEPPAPEPTAPRRSATPIAPLPPRPRIEPAAPEPAAPAPQPEALAESAPPEPPSSTAPKEKRPVEGIATVPGEYRPVEERALLLFARRTDDSRRAPIMMTIRYRRTGDAPGEVSR